MRMAIFLMITLPFLSNLYLTEKLKYLWGATLLPIILKPINKSYQSVVNKTLLY